MTHLMAENGDALAKGMPDEAILITRSMGPVQRFDYDASKLKGMILEEGSRASHVAIVARALGIPVVGRVQDVVSRVNEFDAIIVDANHNQVLIRPDEAARIAFEESVGALKNSVNVMRHLLVNRRSRKMVLKLIYQLMQD